MHWLPALLVACAAAAVPAAPAAPPHEVRPAYLELRQTAPDTYDVLWKVPALGDEWRLGIYVSFPPPAKELAGRHSFFSGNACIERWRIQIAGGLDGQAIHIDGLSATKIDVLVRIEETNGAVLTTRLRPDAPGFVVRAAPSAWSVSGTYLGLGVEHILSGFDHLLYILGMLLIASGWRRILATMTAFTLTHSITLSAAALGFVHVPGPPVEATIALSIVFVAREIALARRGRAGLAHRRPWAVAFAFGLLHGLGFAGALSEVGLPAHAIPFALLSFNVGVEIGQLVFVVAVLALVGIVRRVRSSPGGRGAGPRDLRGSLARWLGTASSWGERVAPYAIGAVAMFWVIQRTAAF